MMYLIAVVPPLSLPPLPGPVALALGAALLVAAGVVWLGARKGKR